MRKVWLIASTEFMLIVQTKAFVFGLFLLPIVTIAIILLTSSLAEDSPKPIYKDTIQQATTPFRLMIVSPDDSLGAPLQARADRYNQENWAFKKTPLDLQTAVSQDKTPEVLTRELDELLLQRKIDAYVLIPKAAEPTSLTWRTLSEDWRLLSWFEEEFNQARGERLMREAGLTEAQLNKINRSVTINPKPIEETPTEAAATPSERLTQGLNFLVPSVLVFLLFTMVMMSIQPLITTALEEKMSRISEVLLGMVEPFSLMMGKLIGSLGASFLVALFYVGTGLLALYFKGYLALVPVSAFGYLLLFLFPALFFFGSLYLAVGAACTDVKDAQALLTPFMLVLMIPLFLLPFLLSEPNGTISVVLSFFPPSAPFVMLMRTAIAPGPPVWQLLLSIVVTSIATGLFVIAAGRVFRAGLLIQGKPPTLGEFIKWSLR